MTDKELLELAAKAAGYELDWGVPAKSPPWVITGRGEERGPTYQFSPLKDDGDALRLAVKLGMQITIILDGDDGNHSPKTMVDWATEEHLNDPYAATRRAITRVAAETGKAKCE
jgi:hypothetical protein